MSLEHTQAVFGLLSVFATSHRVEHERVNAEYEARKGLHAKAIECLQRLLDELDEACEFSCHSAAEAVVSSSPTEAANSFAAEASKFHAARSRQYNDTISRAWRITRLPVPEPQELANGTVKKPLSPTVVTASRRTYKPWPTADADFSRPALKPITFKMERDTLPRLPGDMSGAVHIRRQLDEQEEADEQARTHRWLKDIGQHPDDEDDEGEDSEPRGQKRRAEDELDSPPVREPRRQPPGPRNDASATGSTQNKCFVNDDSDGEGPRNTNPTNKDPGGVGGAPTPPPEEPLPEIPPPVIVMENLRDTFGDGEDDRRARRYRDWFASLIALTESTPGSITAPGFLARYGQRKKLEKLKTALGHMSVRPFEKRQATQRRIKSLEGGMKQCGEAAVKLTDMELAGEWEVKKRQEGLEECYGKMGRDAAALENQQRELASQVALEEKIFVGGVEHGDCFLSWITKTRNNVYWELGFADRTREKPERIKVGRQTYYSV
ncbi:uncharacterized protein LY79DRAFT_667396 [Colletotrichum navitas]|uniref:Uncharacterized protein n=1 Tax=Colletotrichum navitas TaxID=681940 RepID=A0AAD8V934_9PEZI|nr:uncharacterized protein LY79DRAFT_667396 [Colletotrichum navitas]KAK1596361.1 hypothetical protein LY79DRAFT_667396 [Colletotrichum navitas]